MRSGLALAVVCIGLLAAGYAHAYEVEYWADNQPRQLQPASSGLVAKRSYRLESLPLVLSQPAQLVLDNATYTLDQEGLYRIREEHSTKVVRQSFLYRQNVWRFAGHLSRVYVYGDRHLSEKQAQWDEHVRKGEPLSLQCGSISMFIQHHMSEQQIGARLVGCAKGSDWQTFDDGHALLEICDPTERRWVLFDPTIGARLKDGNHCLDLFEATRRYRAGGRVEHIDFLNAGQKLDPLTDYEALYTKHIPDKRDRTAFLPRLKPLLENDTAAIHRWYGKLMQVPLIGNYFAPESDAEDTLFRTLPTWKNLVRLSPAEFRQRFYDQPCCGSRSTVDKDLK